MANDSTDKVIVFVGAKRMGKSTLILETINNRKDVYIFDPEGEYKRGLFMDIDLFKKVALGARNAMIVWEEATSFFGQGVDKDLKAMLSRNRHKYVTHLLVFHSLHDVPGWILTKIDEIYLFHTKDNPTYVKQKFKGRDNITQAFMKLREPTPGKFEVITY